MNDVRYYPPMFTRLEPRTPWAGGRMVDTDVLTLADAASMATKHAGEPVTIGDFLRAAGRGEITLRAIVHRTAKVQKHDGGIYCNGGQENENMVPAGAIATLPLTACQHLAAAGRASWRTFDGFEMVEGVLQRYTKGLLVAGEPDFETVPDDCRVVGYDVHALADEYTAPEAQQAEPQAAPVVAESASNAQAWTIAKPQRFNGYTAPLHRLIAAAHREGKPCPTARDVVEVWRINAPAEIAKVLPDGFDYYDAKGDTKTADLEAIRKAIRRMTSAR
ncbi:MAG: hypothetical protein ACD_23C00205G0002 [uncultured bacterium]|nr:MAG: hypothetical protein ACD_23C00205G0002 [uncultured bacterium]